MREIFCGVLLLFCSSSLLRAQEGTVYKEKQEKLPATVAPQPIAFSHKKHAAVGLSCLSCHLDANDKDQAGLPNVDQCMMCHATIKADNSEVKKLAALQKQGQKLKWVRVYRVPDFVFFSHANHLKAGLECATCHGPVQDRDVLDKEVSTSMVVCMNCHAAKKVSTACYLCHQLGF